MKKGLIAAIVILVLIILGLVWYFNSLKSPDNVFHYTTNRGQNYTFSAQQYNYPLDDNAKCSLLNEALKQTPDHWTCDCEILKLHENVFLGCGIGCVGFDIDEVNKTITSITTCATT